MDTLEFGQIHPTALVSSSAALGDEVTVGPFAVVHDGVEVGARSIIGTHCVLGEPTVGFYDSGSTAGGTRIGEGSIIRSHTVIYQNVTIGCSFRTGHHVTVREGTSIGDDVQIGTMSDLQGDLSVGNHVRLHSNVHVGRLSVIEDFAWLFPYVVLTNDPHPPSDTCTRGALIRRFAVVATNSVIMPGIAVGEHALVGAMSLVTRDVPAETVVVGSPAQSRGSVRDIECQHGALDAVYPWPMQFRRGYPEGVLPDPGSFR